VRVLRACGSKFKVCVRVRVRIRLSVGIRVRARVRVRARLMNLHDAHRSRLDGNVTVVLNSFGAMRVLQRCHWDSDALHWGTEGGVDKEGARVRVKVRMT